jgi:hypothetical protein
MGLLPLIQVLRVILAEACLSCQEVDKSPREQANCPYLETERGVLDMGMTVYNPDGTVASVFEGIERSGNKLVLKQLALGQVPMPVKITPPEALKALGLGMSLGLLTFILFFPYFYFSHRGEEKKKKTAVPAADSSKT